MTARCYGTNGFASCRFGIWEQRKFLCRTHPPPAMKRSSKARLRFAFWGFGSDAGIHRASGVLAPSNPPTLKKKLQKQQTPLCLWSTSPPPQTPPCNTASLHWNVPLPRRVSESASTPYSWRPLWERSGCRWKMGGAYSLCSSSSAWARKDLVDRWQVCPDTPAGQTAGRGSVYTSTSHLLLWRSRKLHGRLDRRSPSDFWLAD